MRAYRISKTLSQLAALAALLPLFGPECIASAAMPDLLVSSRLNDRVLRYNGQGEFVGTFATGGGLDTPNGLAFGPDGNLYVASRDGNQILKYASGDGAFLGVFAEGAEMVGPSDISFGPNGDLFVCNSLADNVSRYNGVTGALVTTYRSDELLVPIGLAFGPDGGLYVSSVVFPRILKLDPETDTVHGIVAAGGFMSGPADIIFDGGTLYAANPPTNTISRFDPVTGAVTAFHVSNALMAPTSLQFGLDGDLYVSSFIGDKVLRLDRTSQLIEGDFIPSALGGLDGPQYILFVPELGCSTAWFAALTLCRRRRPQVRKCL